MEWAHKGSPPRKKPKIGKSQDKVMITVFWDQDCIIFIDNLKRNETINKERYCLSLEKLKRAIKTKRLGLRDSEIKFHQDNARPHTECKPDLTPSDCYLFWRLKIYLRGNQFISDETLISKVKR